MAAAQPESCAIWELAKNITFAVAYFYGKIAVEMPRLRRFDIRQNPHYTTNISTLTGFKNIIL
ncbi:hypothetical protein [Flexibacter flexilis]|uniref:hypothetical protein n=1 Tax=Flexibacter flexilis TaxID=998 RepID=UPI0011604BD2|nr:hypothetical protein [Flexibacter flexilis]